MSAPQHAAQRTRSRSRSPAPERPDPAVAETAVANAEATAGKSRIERVSIASPSAAADDEAPAHRPLVADDEGRERRTAVEGRGKRTIAESWEGRGSECDTIAESWEADSAAKRQQRIASSSDGILPVSAVATRPTRQLLAEVRGVQAMQMGVEEPILASITSPRRLCSGEQQMHTTAITAIAVMKGEAIAQKYRDVDQRVAFQTVRDRLRSPLHTAAEDPDLIEIFEFTVSTDVGQEPHYINHLLEWASHYIDSKARQLRFSAFAVINNCLLYTSPSPRVGLLSRMPSSA